MVAACAVAEPLQNTGENERNRQIDRTKATFRRNLAIIESPFLSEYFWFSTRYIETFGVSEFGR
ncbi:hypothetical protein KDW_02960 [Dictyobacter vulcani]|uniref:Uncharacterized protein n=1 Tax=Dictyobacter vulcani TaxID=2607529 RepID=A0A5J4KBT1_9CHLR|nr:hypothetical protein KDW_02960 [Dictyobacter vulcani]